MIFNCIYYITLQNISPSKTEMIDIVKTLNGALELTQVMEKTIEFGTQPDVECKSDQTVTVCLESLLTNKKNDLLLSILSFKFFY